MELQCCIKCCLVQGNCWLYVLPVFGFVVEPCFLCKVLDLPCQVLPWYVHDVEDVVVVLGRVVVLG